MIDVRTRLAALLTVFAVAACGDLADPVPVRPPVPAVSQVPAWYADLERRLGPNFTTALPQPASVYLPPHGARDLPAVGEQVETAWKDLLTPLTEVRGRRFAVVVVSGSGPCRRTGAQLHGRVLTCAAAGTDYLLVPAKALTGTQVDADVLVAAGFAVTVIGWLGGGFPAGAAAAPEPVYRLAGMSLRTLLPASTPPAELEAGFRLAGTLLGPPYAGAAGRAQWLAEGFHQGTLAGCVQAIRG